MYGLIIASSDEEDVIKVSSSKEKIKDFAEDYMKNYLKNIDINNKDVNYLNFLDAIKVKETEAAIDIFAILSEKYGKPSMMAIAKVDILFDA